MTDPTVVVTMSGAAMPPLAPSRRSVPIRPLAKMLFWVITLSMASTASTRTPFDPL